MDAAQIEALQNEKWKQLGTIQQLRQQLEDVNYQEQLNKQTYDSNSKQSKKESRRTSNNF